MPDSAFASFGLTPRDVTRVRERLAVWPRDTGAVGAETWENTGIRQHAHGTAGEETASAETAAGQPHGCQAEPEDPEIGA